MGLPFIYPDPKLPYVANFLHMMFSMPYEQYVASPEVVEALNLILCSTPTTSRTAARRTVRVVGSSKANLFASCAAGVCALWGPLHGGANVAVLEMLEQIHDGGMTAEQAIEAGQGQEERLQADGLRPPRLQELRPARHDPQGAPPTRCWPSSGSRIRCSTSPRKLEELALKDPYFVDRKLYPNVDFYSGIIMRAIGHPDQHVHGDLRHRPDARLDRPLERAARRPGGPDRPARGRSTPGPTEHDYIPIGDR